MKFEEKTFSQEIITLDFNEFHSCVFRECELIFRGYGTFGIYNCSFNNVRWTFSDAAKQTINFLAQLYKGGEGGKEIVEQVFHSLRGGGPPPVH